MELIPLNRREMIGTLVAGGCALSIVPAYAAVPEGALALVVTDPLAAANSCPCVGGYAQRDYKQLAKYLEAKLGRPVVMAVSESLGGALKKTGGRVDVLVGKHSVTAADSSRLGKSLSCVAALTGKDGATTQTGLVMVPAADPARTVADLKGYKVILGPAECEEKASAAKALLSANGVTLPEKAEEAESDSEAATALVDAGPGGKVAALVSSHAEPLLEGCGTVRKGDLRSVGKTAAVPFVTAWVSDSLAADVKKSLTEALLAAGSDKFLLKVLESREGFVAAGRDGKNA